MSHLPPPVPVSIEFGINDHKGDADAAGEQVLPVIVRSTEWFTPADDLNRESLRLGRAQDIVEETHLEPRKDAAGNIDMDILDDGSLLFRFSTEDLSQDQNGETRMYLMGGTHSDYEEEEESRSVVGIASVTLAEPR